MTSGVLVALDVQVVHLGADTANRPLAAIRHPVLRAGVLEERILLAQHMTLLDEQRRNPIGIVGIDTPRHPYESPQIARGLYGHDAQRRRGRNWLTRSRQIGNR
jgi:hypothetical protein